MKLTIIHSTQGCQDTACPTIYQNEHGQYIIQGFKLRPQDKASIAVPPGEDLIAVPAEFLEAFIDKIK